MVALWSKRTAPATESPKAGSLRRKASPSRRSAVYPKGERCSISRSASSRLEGSRADVEPTARPPVAVDRGVGIASRRSRGPSPSPEWASTARQASKCGLIAVAVEGQQPAGEIAVEARLDVERAIPGIEHPLQSLHAHAGPGERGMPVDDEPGVSAGWPRRGSVPGRAPRTGRPRSVQRPRAREADDAAADDDHGLFRAGHDAGW